MRNNSRTILLILLLLLCCAPTPQAGPLGPGSTQSPVDFGLERDFKCEVRPVFLAALAAGASSDSAQESADVNYEDEVDLGLEAEFAEVSEKKVFDPLSGYNRFMTRVNDRLYFWLLKPVSRGYGKVVPEGARLAVNRFFNNLLMPVRFANNLLQLKLKRAGTELTRFTLNSTIGILGLGDPAQKWFDLKAYPEDFGQTLGHYGIGGGFHIVLPVLGPSNLRDALGLVPDYYLAPVSYVDKWETQWALRSYDKVNYTSLHIGEYESLKKDAVVLYTFLRDAYEQSREKEIEE